MKIMNDEALITKATIASNRINAMENKIAMEWYGCKWDDLDYDDRDLVTCEAYDRLS